MIFAILLIRNYFLLRGNVNGNAIKGMIIIIILAFITLAIIPCIIASIRHIVKAVKYNKVYYKENHYAEWHYSKNEWQSFIFNNFKENNIVEMKSFRKAAIYYFLVMVFAFTLDFLTNSEDRKNIVAYLLISLICFLLYFIPVMFRNSISMIDHMLFANRNVILMCGTVIVDGEILRLDIPLKKEIMKKLIKSGNVEIEYAVPARYSNRYSNRHYLDVKDIKKLLIPIPVGRYKEAEKYINAPLPILHSCYKNK